MLNTCPQTLTAVKEEGLQQKYGEPRYVDPYTDES